MDNGNFNNRLVATPSAMNYVIVPQCNSLICTIKKETKRDSFRLIDFPLIKKMDNQVLLPQYFEVLGRSNDYGVKMEDLNQLQYDLEKLLSTCTVRKKLLTLRNDSTNLNRKIEVVPRQGACCQKQQNLRHKSLHQKYKYPYLQENKFVRMKSRPSVNNSFIQSPATSSIGISAENLNNTLVDSFWCLTEPYVRDIAESDLGFIDKLIQGSRGRIYATTSKGDKKCLRKCPMLRQCVHKEQKITDKDLISLEIEKCVRELAGISKNNVAQLGKLRNKVIKDLYSQQMEMFVC